MLTFPIGFLAGEAEAPSAGGNDAYTMSLLHCDGADTSTTFIDSAVGGSHTWTAYGNAQISTDDPVFGTGALLIDGTGDYLDTPDSDDWHFAADDFTVDCRIKFTTDATGGIFQQFVSDGYKAGFYFESNQLVYYMADASTRAYYVYSFTPTLDTWYHVALVRNGTSLLLMIDGTLVTWTTINQAIGSYSIPNYAAPMNIGRAYFGGSWKYFDGEIDESRISKGIARWTTSFTVPTVAYY